MTTPPDRRKTRKEIRGERRANDAGRIRVHLHRFGRVCIRVRGSSMLPWLRPGDVVVVRRGSPDMVRCGDVVLFVRGNHLFVHRLVEKRGCQDAAYLAKGDAHPTPDGFLAEKELLGRVVRIYRGGRRIDLDSPRQLALGLLLSQISARSSIWYPVARAIAHVVLPARRFLLMFRPSGAALR